MTGTAKPQLPQVESRSLASKDQAAFEALAPGWRALEKCGNDLAFSSYDWNLQWWLHYGVRRGGRSRTLRGLGKAALYGLAARSRELYLMHGGDVRDPDWIAPLARLTYQPLGMALHCLEFLSAATAGFSDLLLAADAPQTIAGFLEALEAQPTEWDCIDLRHFPADSPTPELLAAAAERAGFAAQVTEDGSGLFAKIDAPWKATLQGKSKAAREVFRNQANRLARVGAQIRVLPDPSAEPHLVERVTEVEAAKQVRGAPTLRVMPGEEDFYRTLFATLGPRQRMYAALLELDGVLAAYEWGFRSGRKILAYNKAYRSEYRKFSPGTMLVPAVLDFGYENGYTEYDFVRGEESYKWRWATGSRPAWRVRIWQKSVRGRMARNIFFRAKPRMLRALSALRIRYMSPWEF